MTLSKRPEDLMDLLKYLVDSTIESTFPIEKHKQAAIRMQRMTVLRDRLSKMRC
jgi:hypothetical protein